MFRQSFFHSPFMRIVYLVFLSTILTACPPTPENRVTHVAIGGDKIYAHINESIVISGDYGHSWTRAKWKDVPTTIAEQFDHPSLLGDQVKELSRTERPQIPDEIVQCAPLQPQECYRIMWPEQEDKHLNWEGNAKIEKTSNGGETWNVEWHIPPYRREFMTMYQQRIPFPQKWSPHPGPYDLALSSAEDGHVLVAAMGTEGIVVRDANNRWTQHGVLDATVTPSGIFDPPTLLWFVWPEFILAAILSLVTWGMFSRQSWSKLSVAGDDLRVKDANRIYRKYRRVALSTVGVISIIIILSLFFPHSLIAMVVAYFFAVTSALFGSGMFQLQEMVNHLLRTYSHDLLAPLVAFLPTLPIIILFVCGTIARGVSLGWREILRGVHEQHWPSQVFRATRQTVRRIFISALVFPLWAMGIIPYYWMAWALFAASSLFWVLRTRRILRNEDRINPET